MTMAIHRKMATVAALAAWMALAGPSGRSPAQEKNAAMAEAGAGETILRPEEKVDAPPDARFGIKQARDDLAKNLETFGAAIGGISKLSEAARQSFDGSRTSAMKSNLLALKLVEVRVALLTPVVSSLEEYRCAIRLDIRRGEGLIRRFAAEAERTRGQLDKLAEEVVRDRKALAALAKDSPEALALARRIDDKLGEIETLVAMDEELARYAARSDEAVKADRAELGEIGTLEAQIDQMIKEDSFFVQRAEWANAADTSELVREGRRGLRDVLQQAVRMVKPKGGIKIFEPLTSDVLLPSMGGDDQKKAVRRPDPADPRILGLLQKAERRLSMPPAIPGR